MVVIHYKTLNLSLEKQNNKLGTFGNQPFHIPAYTRRDGMYVYSGVTATFVPIQTKEK